jgi:hypothetical protein
MPLLSRFLRGCGAAGGKTAEQRKEDPIDGMRGRKGGV